MMKFLVIQRNDDDDYFAKYRYSFSMGEKLNTMTTRNYEENRVFRQSMESDLRRERAKIILETEGE